MIRLSTDENISKRLLCGLFRREAGLDLIRVRDIGLAGADDPTILDWAAAGRRVLLTYDAGTMPRHAYDRIAQGRPMSGVVVIRQSARRQISSMPCSRKPIFRNCSSLV